MAAAAYSLDPVTHWAAWEAKVASWVARAQADLLVFPEYGAMELAHLDGADVSGSLEASLWAAARHGPSAQKVWGDLAKHHECHILAPSGPWDTGGARPVNRAWLHGPQGTLGFQDKAMMTRFEDEVWTVSPGQGQTLFEIDGLRVGVLICYDAEFPALAAAHWDQGADALLVPSCTDSLVGFTRVQVGVRARALEGQGVVAQAVTVGACPWSPAMDENHGHAGIYGPPDLGFPDTGILAEGDMNRSGWVRAAIDPAAIATVRADGQVLNHRHRALARAAAKRRR
ncbi:MAG: carbon-nitrogen hydrolase family protein [Pseudomonadota bacterium]